MRAFWVFHSWDCRLSSIASGLGKRTEVSLEPCDAILASRAPRSMGVLALGKKNSILGSLRYSLAACMNRHMVSMCTADATLRLLSTGSYTTSGASIFGPLPRTSMTLCSRHLDAASSTPRKLPNLTTSTSQRYPENPLESCSAP